MIEIIMTQLGTVKINHTIRTIIFVAEKNYSIAYKSWSIWSKNIWIAYGFFFQIKKNQRCFGRKIFGLHIVVLVICQSESFLYPKKNIYMLLLF